MRLSCSHQTLSYSAETCSYTMTPWTRDSLLPYAPSLEEVHFSALLEHRDASVRVTHQDTVVVLVLGHKQVAAIARQLTGSLSELEFSLGAGEATQLLVLLHQMDLIVRWLK